MDYDQLKRLKPTAKNWEYIVTQVCELLTSQPENIDWEELLQAISHFPDEFRGAQNYRHLWMTKEFEPLLQLMTTMRVHRETYTAKFGSFCMSPHSKNIKKVALDYRDSDDDYVGISALFLRFHFQKLESLRLKHYVLIDTEFEIFEKYVSNFSALRHVELIGNEAGYGEVAEFLGQHNIKVTQARSYRDFLDQGYDFWE